MIVRSGIELIVVVEVEVEMVVVCVCVYGGWFC